MNCLRLVACLCVYLAAAAKLTCAGFPSEAELRAKVHSGMSQEEAASLFGPATLEKREKGSVTLLYHASPNELTNQHEGYAGFELRFAGNRLVAWWIRRETPSFRSNAEIPSELKWLLGIFSGIIFLLLLYRRFLRWLGGRLARGGIFESYRWREIRTESLPFEFRFIDHATTLRDVFRRLGDPSRILEVPVDQDSPPGVSFVKTIAGLDAIVAAEYRLPSGSPVYIMPDFPFEETSRIRAAYRGSLPIEIVERTRITE
ncbi:MAG: hypothetical protein JO354_00880 [Verrucomicrobia bacterium]|nr:hypothetical protein [Verrucomicrobiota bacterium]